MPDVILYGESHELNHYLLKRLLKRAGLDEAHFRKVSLHDKGLHHCPESVIVTLGDKPLQELLGESSSFRWFNRVVPLKNGRAVIPNLLPSSLLPFKDPDIDSDEDGKRHPPRLHGVVMASLKKALSYAREPTELHRTEHYLLDPRPDKFDAWVRHYLEHENLPPLAVDIETPYSVRKHSEESFDESEYDKEILRISFSYRQHEAVSIPFSPEYYAGIRLLLECPARKVVWNGRTFDKRILEFNNFPVYGEIYDAMDAWHFIQSDLEKGLEFVAGILTDILPWKHLNNDQPAYYSCVDADATIQVYYKLTALLDQMGLTEAYALLSTECMYYLDRAGQRGNFVDRERQENLRILLKEKKEEVLARIQTRVPEELKPFTIYKKPPAVPHTIIGGEGKVKKCAKCHRTITNKGEHQKGQDNPCKGADTYQTTGEVSLYKVLEPFNPNSSLQVINYIKHFNHPLGKNHKTKSETADTRHLRILVGKYGKTHPIYADIIEIHKISKALSTYVEGLKPDSSGKVYSTYVNAPSTWRLSSRNVNMQNQGKRESNPYAKEARRTIIAPPGHLLIQADSSSIEAVFVGYFMHDPHYIELAKRSIHAYLCCKWLNWEFTPTNVKRIKTEYKELYEQLKRVNHGTNYGMGPRLMYANDPEVFKSLKEAKRCQEFLFEQLPGLQRWHHEVRTRAQKEGYLQNPYGIRHYFYDVFTYQTTNSGSIVYGNDGLPKIKLGKDAKRAIAFLPQSTAGCFARENIVLLGRSSVEPYMPANVTVHDGYTLCVPKNRVDMAIEVLYTTLTRPIKEMGGLTVGCEVEIGENWGEMEKVKI